jgi:hypothetical protein
LGEFNNKSEALFVVPAASSENAYAVYAAQLSSIDFSAAAFAGIAKFSAVFFSEAACALVLALAAFAAFSEAA